MSKKRESCGVFFIIAIFYTMFLYLCVMIMYITEVQLTCFFLMTLVSVLLAWVLPGYVRFEKVYDKARKLLLLGTLLVALHFAVQYALQRSGGDVAQTRTLVNLLFGIPISYMVNMSYIYMQHQGKIGWNTWLFAPLLFVIEVAVLFIAWQVSDSAKAIRLATYIMALLYATTLFYYAILILKKHHLIVADIAKGKSVHLASFITHTRSSMFLMVMLAFGFPLMTFNLNLVMRSIYGLIAISVCFFYIVNFVLYGLYGGVSKVPHKVAKLTEENEDAKSQLTAQKLERMDRAVARFIQLEEYVKPSITLKEVADWMGVSPNMLRLWLQQSPYGKFNNWLTILRLEKAKRLLVERPNISYDSIADKCGFCDRQYFSRQFRKQEGCTPLIWLKNQLQTTQ